MTVTVTDANGDIYLIAGDDKEYSLMGSAAVKLTFPDTTGFDCFEVGDVVQGDPFGNAYAANYFLPMRMQTQPRSRQRPAHW